MSFCLISVNWFLPVFNFSDVLLFSFVLLSRLCAVFPLRHDISDIPIHHLSILPLSSQSSSVPFHLSKMDSSSRNRMPTPSNQQSSRHQAPEQTSANTIPPVSELGGRFDHLALVQQTLQNGPTPYNDCWLCNAHCSNAITSNSSRRSSNHH